MDYGIQIINEDLAKHSPETIAAVMPEKRIDVFCDLCDRQSSGTRTDLRSRGWYLGRGEAICPAHD